MQYKFISRGNSNGQISIIILFIAFVILLFALSKCETDRIKIVPQPMPVQKYTVFLPSVGKSPRVSKKGLAAATGSQSEVCADVTQLRATWIYNWGTNPVVCSGVESIPMIWGAGAVESPIADSQFLLLFNEPDLCNGQSCLPIAEALPLHRRVEELHPERLLIAPVPSHLAPEWIREFRAAYFNNFGEYPAWHALAVHCYFVNEPSMQGCIALVRQYVDDAKTWNINRVWVTEFSAVAVDGLWNLEQAAEAENRFITFLENEPVVKRYAHFTNRIPLGSESWCPGCEPMALVDNLGVLTALGRMYQAW